jgi:putative ABC transport system permease protein
VETILQDARYALRLIIKNPGVSVIAVLALALGIGATSAIFSVVNAVLLRPLPYKSPDQLMAVWEQSLQRDVPELPISYANYRDWVEQNQVFDQLAIFSFTGFNLAGAGEPERVIGVRASANLFPLLQEQPIIGRAFTEDEDRTGGAPVVVLSHALWQRRFSSDPQIVGKTVTLNNQGYTVVGVMRAGFEFPAGLSFRNRVISDRIEFWTPIAPIAGSQNRGAHSHLAIGRLKTGVSLEQARTEMSAIQARLEQQYPEANSGISIRLLPLHEQITGNTRPALLILLGAVGLVLLIACANVANLLLARATARQKEIAIRTAMGASRWRIVRQLLTESVILSITGGAMGLLLALWGTSLLFSISPNTIPRSTEVGIDSIVLLFTLAVSILTGLLFGLAPALQTSRLDLNETLKEGARGTSGGVGRNRVRSALVAAEVALSLVLLVGAGLLIKSFIRLQQSGLGFSTENLLTMRVSLPPVKYADEQKQAAFFKESLERFQNLPGVQTASAITTLPLTANYSATDFLIEGQPVPPPGEEIISAIAIIGPNYFRAMEVPLIAGRDFTEYDNREAPGVAIVSEGFAESFLGGEDPVGKRIAFGGDNPEWLSVVGVVRDVKHFGLDVAARPVVYTPFMQQSNPQMSLVLRTATDPASFAALVRREIQAVDKDQPISDVRTMEQLLSDSVSGRRFSTLLLGLFASVALTLAAVGIYGVMSYSVTQRKHEIGIRMALGASSQDVLRLIVGQGMTVALAGVAVGLAASFALTRLMESLLFGVSATDPVTFIVIPLILAGVALGACFVPARKAARVDPMIALRYE